MGRIISYVFDALMKHYRLYILPSILFKPIQGFEFVFLVLNAFSVYAELMSQQLCDVKRLVP